MTACAFTTTFADFEIISIRSLSMEAEGMILLQAELSTDFRVRRKSRLAALLRFLLLPKNEENPTPRSSAEEIDSDTILLT